MDEELPGPEEPDPPYGRTAHPYFLHEMIRSQPAAIRATWEGALRTARDLPRPPAERDLLFIGLGTSFHAARAAAWAAERLLEGRPRAVAVDSFDLLLDPGRTARAGAALVFSSSGETALTIRAQELLRSTGVPHVLVTGTARSRSSERADHVLRTQEAVERAWVHTVSYTTAIAAAIPLLAVWSGRASVDLAPPDGAVGAVVDREEEWRRLAEEIRDRPKILCLGSGPADATAREAALKLREGAGRFVAAVGIEEFLHGVLPSVDRNTAVLATATSQLQLRRAATALTAAARAGAKTALFGRGSALASPVEHELPPVAREATPVLDIVPYQFVTYWLAVGEGRNPDVMGYDDPRILAARRTYGI